MLSKKCQKYISKYQERNYAPKKRKLEKSDLEKHCHGSTCWKAGKASGCDSLQQSGQEPKEEIVLGTQAKEPDEYVRQSRDKESRERQEEQGDSSRSFMAVQDVPEKQTEHQRKKRNLKKCHE